MDISIYVPKGCVYTAIGGDSPYWQLSTGLPGSCPAWITSANLTATDLIATMPCFSNIKTAGIIGRNFGQASIQGVALLGSVDNLAGFEGAFQALMDTSRASSSGKQNSLSSKGGANYKILINGYAMGNLDPERNILNFTITALVL